MRLAIISDIHEDIQGLNRILKKADRIGYDRLVCLGDVSGFSVPYYLHQKERNAHECLGLLKEKSCLLVPGNHDFHAAARIPESSPLFEFPEDWYALDYPERKKQSDGNIWLHEEDDLDPLYSREDKEYLGSLQEYQVIKCGEFSVLLSHYVYPNLFGIHKRFYNDRAEFSAHFEYMEKQNCALSFHGHTHHQGISVAGTGYLRHYRFVKLRLNEFPVCVGIPPVAGNHFQSGFCIFDSGSNELRAIRC
ncbi:MAG: metallophosphoesterase family protein [Bacteroidota bacterium]